MMRKPKQLRTRVPTQKKSSTHMSSNGRSCAYPYITSVHVIFTSSWPGLFRLNWQHHQ